MYAGSSGYAYGANTHSEGNGNGFLQGLVSTVNKRAGLIRFIRTEAGGQNRNVVFCMNQLGGVGKRSNMFASNADGVHQPCQGSDQVLKALETLYEAFLDGEAGTDDGEIDQAEAQALGISPQVFQQILNLYDNDGDNEVDEKEIINALLKNGKTLTANIKYGIWLETPGAWGAGNSYSGNIYSPETLLNTDKMTEWISGLNDFISSHGEKSEFSLVVRIPTIEKYNSAAANWPDVTNTTTYAEYWDVVSTDNNTSATDKTAYGGAGGTPSSVIYSLEKDADGNFYKYTLAWLIQKHKITKVSFLPELSGNTKLSGPSSSGGDVDAYGPTYDDYTNLNTDQSKQINADLQWIMQCCLYYQEQVGFKEGGMVMEVEGIGIQYQYNQGKPYQEPDTYMLTFNPLYDAILHNSATIPLGEKVWTWGLCYYNNASAQDAAVAAAGTIMASYFEKTGLNNFNIELLPEWYGWPTALKAGGCGDKDARKPCVPGYDTLWKAAMDNPEVLIDNIADHWKTKKDVFNGEEIGNPVSLTDTPSLFIDNKSIGDSELVEHWENIWKKTNLNWQTDIFDTTQGNSFKLKNLKNNALQSIESYFGGGPPNEITTGEWVPSWTIGPGKQMYHWANKIAETVGTANLQTTYFSASYIMRGLNNWKNSDGALVGPEVDVPADICGAVNSCS